jgi:hypothetical protein
LIFYPSRIPDPGVKKGIGFRIRKTASALLNNGQRRSTFLIGEQGRVQLKYAFFELAGFEKQEPADDETSVPAGRLAMLEKTLRYSKKMQLEDLIPR